MCPMKMVLECENDNVVEDSLSSSSNDSDLVSKCSTKAFIWKYFGFEPNEKGNPQSKNHPKCCLCRLEITAKDGNTSNLNSHLKNKHPQEYDIVQKAAANTSRKRQSDTTQLPMQQLLLEATWDKTKLYSSSSHEYKDLTKLVTYCLAKDMLPISTVDKPGFKAICFGSLILDIICQIAITLLKSVFQK